MIINYFDKRQIKRNSLLNRAVTDLRAIYGTNHVDNIINIVHVSGLYHQFMSFGKKHYHYWNFTTNLVLAHYKMKGIRHNAIARVNKLIRLLLIIQKIDEIKHPTYVYTVLSTLKDCRPTKQGWRDKCNNDNPYTELSNIFNKLHQQIRELKSLNGITGLVSDIENPYHHIKKLHTVYSHAHHHGCFLTDNKDQIHTLQHKLDTDYIKTTGYNPIHNVIRPLKYKGGDNKLHNCVFGINKQLDAISLDALDRYINYLLTDYHIQTKDCDYKWYKHTNWSNQHFIIKSQLISTKSKRIDKVISSRKVQALHGLLMLKLIIRHEYIANKQQAYECNLMATKYTHRAINDIRQYSWKLKNEKALISTKLALIDIKLNAFNALYTKKADNQNGNDYRTVCYTLICVINDVHKSYFTGSDVLSMTKSTGIPP